MGASSVQSLSIWDLPKGYSKVCSMQCFTSIVHRVGDTPPGTYSKTVSLGPSDHSCNVTLSRYLLSNNYRQFFRLSTANEGSKPPHAEFLTPHAEFLTLTFFHTIDFT